MNDPLWSLKEYAESIGMTYARMKSIMKRRGITAKAYEMSNGNVFNGNILTHGKGKYKLSYLKEILKDIEKPTP